MHVSRRSFIKLVAGTSLGLIFEIDSAHAQSIPAESFQPNSWLKITRDNQVIIQIAKSEMGQGVRTALATIVAEEMDADWTKVSVETAALDQSRFGYQQTGGSSSVRSSWIKLRKAGACARHMFLLAAANKWFVPIEECRTEKSTVIHLRTSRILPYGDLIDLVSVVPLPADPVLKKHSDFKLIGKNIKRVDTTAITSGKLKYGIDEQIPGMLYATLIKPPSFDGSLKTVTLKEAKTPNGIMDFFPLQKSLAVVATSTWSALSFHKHVTIEWNPGRDADLTTEKLLEYFKAHSKKQPVIAIDKGADLDTVPGTIVEANYFTPFVAHVPMEPLNCIIDLRNDHCDIWVSTQAPEEVKKAAAEISGLSESVIKVHVSMIGGSFGRRLEVDYVREAMAIAIRVRKPLQYILSREEDIRHDYYRPASYHSLSAKFTSEGKVRTWHHQVTAPSIIKQRWNELEKTHGDWITREGLDETAVLGAADLSYQIPTVRVSYVMANTIVPISWWRGTYDSLNAFAKECFIDEIAYALKKDAMLLRMELLTENTACLNILNIAAEKSNWFEAPPQGNFRGMAIHTTFGVPVVHVVELTIKGSEIKVVRVTSVIDCGLVINPDMVCAQVEGSIIDGLSTALKSELLIENGGAKQNNFHNYSLLRFKESPEINVHIVAGGQKPLGVGEPAVPPVAPAVANALFAATGKRFRSIPIKL